VLCQKQTCHPGLLDLVRHHTVVNAAGIENALGESSTINSIVVSSKHPNAELFVKTAFIVWEVVEKLAGNGLVIKPHLSLLKEQRFVKISHFYIWSFTKVASVRRVLKVTIPS
jgi:hypothetical protein